MSCKNLHAPSACLLTFVPRYFYFKSSIKTDAFATYSCELVAPHPTEELCSRREVCESGSGMDYERHERDRD